MRIKGTINEWKIDKAEDEYEDEDKCTFSVSTDFGDFYKIDATELDEVNLDEIIKAMRDQKPVIFTDELTPTVEYNGLDFIGYGQGARILGRWTVIKGDPDPASRTLHLRVRDDKGPIGYADVDVPDNPIQLSRCYIKTTLLYGDLYRKAEALAYHIGEGTDTREELRAILDDIKKLTGGRA